MKYAKLLLVSIAILAIIMVNPAAADYTMFHADEQRTGAVAADGPMTNNILWSVELSGNPDASPVVYDGKVFTATWPTMDMTGDMYLYCLDENTHEEIWKNKLGTNKGSVSGMAIGDGKIFLGGTDGILYAVTIANGKTAWSRDLLGGNYSFYGLSAAPLAYNNSLYVLSPTDGLHVIDYDGNPQWNFSTGKYTYIGMSGSTQLGNFMTSVAAKDNTVYFGGPETADNTKYRLYSVNTTTRNEIWNVSIAGSVRSSPVIGDSKVFVTTTTNLYAFGTENGNELWNITINGGISTPAYADSRLFVGTKDGFSCYNTGDWSQAWKSPEEKTVSGSPVVAGSIVYYATDEKTGTVYARNVSTGDEVWQYALPAPEGEGWAAFYASSPAVSDGTLYIGAENSKFYAFHINITLWKGNVTLNPGPPTSPTTFEYTPAANTSAHYTWNLTTDLGALNTAAEKGNFTFETTDLSKEYGSFMLKKIAEYENEPWNPGVSKSWAILINNKSASLGLGLNNLKDGDLLEFYYCPTNPVTWAPETENATAVVRINVDIPAYVIPTIWDGNVTLNPGSPASPSTFEYTPAANTSAHYTWNLTTDLGALNTAAKGNFTFETTDLSKEYGSFMLKKIAEYENEPWNPGVSKSWAILINNDSASLGLGLNNLKDGDLLEFYYCPTSSVTWAPEIENATAVVRINVDIPAYIIPTIWDGNVTLNPGTPDAPSTFEYTPAANTSAHYTWNLTTDLGALNASAEKGDFTFETTDLNKEYGSFMLKKIAEYENEPWNPGVSKSWAILINNKSATLGLGLNNLKDGDLLEFYYCPTNPVTWAPETENATAVVRINVDVPTITISDLSLSNGARGGDIIARMTVTPLFIANDGWYVIVVSGTNGQGSSIAGISTVKLDNGDVITNLPALVHIPQEAKTGTYTLHAGIYNFDTFPEHLISSTGGVQCIVS